MHSEMEYIKMAERLMDEANNAIEFTNVANAQFAAAMDTVLQIQKEKDSEYLLAIQNMENRHIEDKANMRKHYQKIILSLSLVLLLIVGSLIGGLVYLVSNYDIGFQVYQEVTSEGGGDSTIEDGFQFTHPGYEKETD